MSIGKRVREARTDAKMSQAQLARKVGIRQPTLSDLERGESHRSANLASMAAALGVNALWLETGRGPKRGGDKDKAMLRNRVREVSDEEEEETVSRIRRVTLRLSAGIIGFAVDSDSEDDNPIYFRKDWLLQRGYKPENLLAIRVKGTSMEPGLYEGDTVVINTADTAPKDGDVYAVNYEGEAVIKRLVRDAGAWWLSSDNPDQRRFPRKQCDGDTCLLIGKVIHKQSERI